MRLTLSRIGHSLSYLLLLFSGVVITGCATTAIGPAFQLEPPPTGKAIVYHYRLSSFYGKALIHNVLANKKPLIAITNGGYFRQTCEPGEMIYISKVQAKVHPLLYGPGISLQNHFAKFHEKYRLDIKPGKIYFLRWVGDAEYKPKEIPQSQAIKEIKELKEFESLATKQQ